MSSDSSYPQDRPSGPPTEPVPEAPDDARPPEQAYAPPPTAALPPYQQPPYQQQHQQPQYQQPQYPPPYQRPPTPDGRIAFQPSGPTAEHPQAVLAFVLGLLSVLGLLITGPFGWYLGRRVVREIDRDPRQFSNRGLAMTGMVLGIIGTVFMVLVVALIVIGIVLAVTVGASSSGRY